MRQNDTHHSCWDYVEVRNGEGPFSPQVCKFIFIYYFYENTLFTAFTQIHTPITQVGVFCGGTAPGDILSSRSSLWVKFFSDRCLLLSKLHIHQFSHCFNCGELCSI